MQRALLLAAVLLSTCTAGAQPQPFARTLGRLVRGARAGGLRVHAWVHARARADNRAALDALPGSAR